MQVAAWAHPAAGTRCTSAMQGLGPECNRRRRPDAQASQKLTRKSAVTTPPSHETKSQGCPAAHGSPPAAGQGRRAAPLEKVARSSRSTAPSAAGAGGTGIVEQCVRCRDLATQVMNGPCRPATAAAHQQSLTPGCKRRAAPAGLGEVLRRPPTCLVMMPAGERDAG